MVTAEKNLFYEMFDPGSMYVVVVWHQPQVLWQPSTRNRKCARQQQQEFTEAW